MLFDTVRPIGQLSVSDRRRFFGSMRAMYESGISAGDRVVVEGLAKVRPDTPVKVVDAAQPAKQS